MTHHPLTFLFTDLENSTPLWENFPEAMRKASARHDALMRGIIEQHRGWVVRTTGDGFHAAFEAQILKFELVNTTGGNTGIVDITVVGEFIE